ncbi:GntR family transcriptional regulator [Oceanispirochaeta crateris]|uniref:GntR family transcriptional regulator n=1 Tax=Oceanispirochaeta crateris TaxID=2518645 RepID=A0A5C1QHB5_9SPIO|nr:GntR family transcriptional regulator [Oceanispirochaeta crateris]QEN06728.1 GntR family transcriptional regulator [Oceanispirochaeta crateris]
MNQNIREPLYLKIYKDFLDRIDRGDFKNNDKIPTEVELSESYNVSRITTRKALNMLSEQGIVNRVPGLGSFISEDGVEKTINQKIDQHSKTKRIGFIISGIQDSFGHTLLSTLEDLLYAKWFSLLLGISDQNAEKESRLLKSFIEQKVDGIIISPVDDENFSTEILSLVMKKFPIVLVDRYLRDLGNCSNVVSDNEKATFTAVNYLFEHNHKNIAVFSRKINSTSTLTERYNGVINAYAERGLPVNKNYWYTSFKKVEYYSKNLFVHNIELIKEFLTQNREITAVVTMEYLFTQYLISAISEMGLSIPDDISLVGFDGPGYSVENTPALTYVMQDEAKIAQEVFSLLMKAMKGVEKSEKILVPCTFIEGTSVRSI